MSSDSESKVVVAGTSAEDIVQREAVFGNIYKKKMIQRRNARIVIMNLKLGMQILLVCYAI